MSKSSSIKDMRKQLKNVVQECLGDVLKDEMSVALKKELTAHIDKRLTDISRHMETMLDAIDKRSRDVSSSLLRAVSPILPTKDINT
jgi:hypothetical protein